MTSNPWRSRTSRERPVRERRNPGGHRSRSVGLAGVRQREARRKSGAAGTREASAGPFGQLRLFHPHRRSRGRDRGRGMRDAGTHRRWGGADDGVKGSGRSSLRRRSARLARVAIKRRNYGLMAIMSGRGDFMKSAASSEAGGRRETISKNGSSTMNNIFEGEA